MKTLVYCGYGDLPVLQQYASSIGYRYQNVHLQTDITKTHKIVKGASMVAVWNGRQTFGPQMTSICHQRRIPIFYIEQGMLPQSATFFIDPLGFCSDSILYHDLSWINDNDMKRLYSVRANLQQEYPIVERNFILVPLQVESDSSVLYFSKYSTLEQFVDDVKDIYSNENIVVRPHPGESNEILSKDVTIEQGCSFLEHARHAKKIVSITSTCLYEAAILGIPVQSFGDHPFALHPPELHDCVAAGALALCVPRCGDIKPVLDRFYFGWPD